MVIVVMYPQLVSRVNAINQGSSKINTQTGHLMDEY